MLWDTGKSIADARGHFGFSDLRAKLCASEGSLPIFIIPSFADISEPLNTKLFFSTVGHIVDQLGAL